MNYVCKQRKTFRTFAAFVAAMVMLVLAGAAVPTQAQTFNVIYDFTGSPSAQYPTTLVQGRNGEFYVGTYQGGANNLGAIFDITTSGTLTALYSLVSADNGPGYEECSSA